MTDKSLVAALDVALLTTASLFDLGDREERTRSARALRSLFINITALIRPSAVLEIGAFEASFSVEIKERLPEASVFAFEANPHNYKNFAPRHQNSGIDYIHSAVASEPGSISFFLQESRDGVALSRTRGNNSTLRRMDPLTRYEEITVPAISVDAFCEQRGLQGIPVAAWIDVEGAVGKVLAGAKGTLPSAMALMVEVEDAELWEGQVTSSEVCRILGEYGLLPLARDFEYPSQYNYIFARPDVIADAGVRAAVAYHYSSLRVKGEKPR